MAEDRRDVGLLAITSADRLNAGWTAAERARQRGSHMARSHIERLLAPLSRDCGIVTVLDGHPATLAWLGGVHGHRRRSLGVEHFGQTGTHRRPLPPPRHRCQRHPACRPGRGAGPANAESKGAGIGWGGDVGGSAEVLVRS